MLNYIIPSKARRKILSLFYHNPKEPFYLRRIVREVHEEVNAVKRELDILSEGKVVTKERRLNKVFYSLNKSYIFYDEFTRIFAKTAPLNEKIQKNNSRLGRIKFVAVSAAFVKGDPVKEDDLVLLFVGTLVIPEIEQIMLEIEKSNESSINYTVMTEDEFAFRKKNNDPFIWRFLRQPKIMLAGFEEDFVK